MDDKLILSLINKNVTNAILSFSYMAMQSSIIKQYCIQKGIYLSINEYMDNHKLTLQELNNCNYEYFSKLLFNDKDNCLQP